MARVRYAVRFLSIPEDGEHECEGRIVAVLQSTFNSASRTWYLTALVERAVDPEVPDRYA